MIKKVSCLIISKNIIFFSEFICSSLNKDAEEASRSALKSYVDTAKVIRANDFENSVADKLEKIICGDLELLKSVIGLKARENTYDLSKAFITLAAPSLEGKTQFAFVLEKIRPLYFALKDCNKGKKENEILPLYLNFDDLSRCIYFAAHSDIVSVDLDPPENMKDFKRGLFEKFEIFPEQEFYAEFSADSLLKYLKSRPFQTLGLLYYLVNDARHNYDTLDVNTRPSWLEYHANRKDFYFISKSIDEIPTGFFDGYCLFLDEYDGTVRSYFMRNLAEAVGLRCVVSNTNSYAKALRDNKELLFSTAKNKTRRAWSIIVTELKMGNYQTLNTLTGIDENINWICENSISDQFKNDKAHCRAFFDDFKEKQILELRPGIAVAVANIIKEFKDSHQEIKITFGRLLSYVTTELHKFLLKTKFLFGFGKYFDAANLSFSMGTAYDKNYIDQLDSHLFYMINPSNRSKWAFMTIYPEDWALEYSGMFCFDEETRKGSPMVHQSAYFKPDEILTQLACMNLVFRNLSFTKIVERVMLLEVLRVEFHASAKKVQLSYLSSICFSSSSHRGPREAGNSFSGQSGTNYLQNLLINSLPRLVCDRLQISTVFEFGDNCSFNIQEYLDRITIPYLFVAGMEIPDVFKTMMNGSAIENRSINIGTISETFDRPHFDFQFNYQYRSADNKISSHLCKADRSEWYETLVYQDLLKKVSYAKDAKDSLCIIVCNALGKAHSNAIRIFDEYCEENGINTYKIKLNKMLRCGNNGIMEYLVSPLNAKESEDPSLIVLVLELSESEMVKVKEEKP